ncbi:putative toxin-antitoxin system antitoxin component (TIGR02293 family) [Marinobacter persicus]|jgi:hypothetical protein|uniref:Toxin-antitoxin system antitoxin component (TIGR02293 family) n=1 Tax=Marinobacter persicus TaxID=930118 RepID=A0A2S6G5R7_9GAMM|nr:putative toxin-antitoxin system antitoxin component (TIGR02293 family) [Marinobacter persicus]PPK54360.1 putative toxin-antitoxin system antitoxin component (TIGR02293 family) [Marinobacter persicus]PPK57692.1 putative toxin-antitoxin system antitoxin component (TIGR02293 family) [Marinobacter persicus]|tara:strand:- start:202 stop:573 length:372 start_codon:yes stop_codon:yes gene_type:complete
MPSRRITKIRVSETEVLIALPLGVLADSGFKDGQLIQVTVEDGTIILNSGEQGSTGDNLDGLVAQIHMKALDLFEGDEAARDRWMRSPIRALGWKSPDQMLQSVEDIETLCLVIGRLDRGSFP